MTKLFPFLLCVALSAYAAILEWDANIETNVAGYRVYRGTSSRLYTSVFDVGGFTVFPIVREPSRIIYFFAVTAYDADGLESDFSDEVSWTNKARPSVVGGLRISETNDCISVVLATSTNLVEWLEVFRTNVVTGTQEFFRTKIIVK